MYRTTGGDWISAFTSELNQKEEWSKIFIHCALSWHQTIGVWVLPPNPVSNTAHSQEWSLHLNAAWQHHLDWVCLSNTGGGSQISEIKMLLVFNCAASTSLLSQWVYSEVVSNHLIYFGYHKSQYSSMKNHACLPASVLANFCRYHGFDFSGTVCRSTHTHMCSTLSPKSKEKQRLQTTHGKWW